MKVASDVVPDNVPPARDVLEQLERMLGARRFKAAAFQKKFLTHVVHRALEGQKSTEDSIGRALIPGFKKDEDTKVRVTAITLRRNLRKYFEREGSDDPVRIFIPDPPEDRSLRAPEGEAYTPKFSYHPFQAVSFKFKVGQALRSQDSVGALSRAIHNFSEVLELSPEHLGAALGMVEAWCSAIYWLENSDEYGWLDKIANEAAKVLYKVKERASKHWKLHAIHGFLCLEMDALDLAKAPFEQAFSLSRASTESYPPYLRFLARSGERERALRLAQQYLEERLGNANAYVEYADVALWAGQMEEASKTLEIALKVCGESGLVHHRLFFIRLLQRRFDEAIVHHDWMAQLLDSVACESTNDSARRLIETWPEEERQTLHELALRHERRRQAISSALESTKE